MKSARWFAIPMTFSGAKELLDERTHDGPKLREDARQEDVLFSTLIQLPSNSIPRDLKHVRLEAGMIT